MWCHAGDTFTSQFTGLGENVTISCDIAADEVTWLLLNPPDLPVKILHTFSNPPTHFYLNETYRQKYSVQSNDLIIKNITYDDLAVYYCADIDASVQFSSGTRLQLMAPSQLPKCQNYTEVKYIKQNQTPWRTFTIISGLLNALLVIVVIVFVIGHKMCKGQSERCTITGRLQTQVQPKESIEPEYTEVNFSKPRKPFRPNQVQSSTYDAIKVQ